ncbi:hypothetical protein ABDK56_11115 [Sphingomonas sp. ASV193]|uniref:hypothetical protein n=1 Tax=Sphingomonas sp. ASV193 TaxID=3144405 RepID=UPI0032E87182
MVKITPCSLAAAAISLVCSRPALAGPPSLDEVVYGAKVEPGISELETRYGRLTGGPADGEDAFVIEASHGFSTRFYGAALAIVPLDPGGPRKLDAFALEGIAPLGPIKSLGIDTALYVELEKPIHEPANLETKLLLEKKVGRFDSRLNLISEKSLGHAEPIELRYAASADVEVAEDVHVGAEAFGQLGTTRRVTARGDHYLGPSVSTEFPAGHDRKLELRAGYLLAIDRARNEAKGQLRVGLALEFGDHDKD